jgi:tetratricopeptide (TPR) repeat protein
MNKNLPFLRMLLLLVPPLAIFAVYASTMGHGKVWDDWIMLSDAETYTNPVYWKTLLSQPLPFSRNYFRPLVVFTFVLEGYSGATDAISHLVNILLHCVNSVLVALICLKLWPQERPQTYRFAIAVGVAMLFATHQVMSEGVIWLVGRFDLMVTTALLLAILADIAVRAPVRRALLVSLAFLAALLCKEMAVTLPLILMLLHAARSSESGIKYLFSRDRILLYASLCIAMAIYLMVRYAALGYLMTVDAQMPFLNLGTPLQKLLLVGACFMGYLKTMLLPGTITPLHYVSLPVATTSMVAWVGLAALLGVCGMIVFLIRREATRFIGYCLAACLVCLLPVLQIIPGPMLLGNTLDIDRAAIFPIALLLIGLGQYAARVVSRKQAVYTGVAALLWVALSVPGILAIKNVWKYDFALWSYLTQANPACSYCHTNLAGLMIYAASPQAALEEADIGMRLAAQPWQAAHASGVRAKALLKLKRPDEALAAAVKAEELEAVASGKTRHALLQARILTGMGRMAEAARVIERVAKSEDGGSIATIGELARLALAAGRPDLARQFNASAMLVESKATRAAVEKRTDNPQAWTRMGDQMKAAGDLQKAEEAYAEAARLQAVHPASAAGPVQPGAIAPPR